MSGLTRFGVSIDSRLIKKFDALVGRACQQQVVAIAVGEQRRTAELLGVLDLDATREADRPGRAVAEGEQAARLDHAKIASVSGDQD